MDNERVQIFKRFLDKFETDSMRDYCKDLLMRTPLNFWCYATKAYNCPGGLVMQTLVGCEICNCFLNLKELQTVYDRPKMRDSLRIAVCFRCIKKTDWLHETVVQHDIKPALKDYIAMLIDSFKKYGDVAYDKDARAFVYFCNSLSLVVPITEEQKQLITKIALPDPEQYFFESGPFKSMNFWLVYQMDKNYLKSLKEGGDAIQEPLRSYLKEYV